MQDRFYCKIGEKGFFIFYFKDLYCKIRVLDKLKNSKSSSNFQNKY